MATTRTRSKAPAKQAPAPETTEDDLFDSGPDDDLFAEFDDDADLLNEVEEDDSEGWVPEEAGEGIQGIVTKIGRTRSDYEDDPEKAMVPTWTIQTKDGTKWRVIGFGAVLRREMQDAEVAGLAVGDLAAIKYFGEKLIKKGKFAGKPYKHYGVAWRSAQAKQG